MKKTSYMGAKYPVLLVTGLGSFFGVVHLPLAQDWQATGAPAHSWKNVACSADGTKLVAVTDGGSIYSSTNSGATWNQTSAPSNEWSSVACSADGIKLMAAGGTGSGDGLIYMSTNSGATWNQAAVPPFLWNSVASSADGTKIVAVSADFVNYQPTTYISTNSGSPWVQEANFGAGGCLAFVASSADGAKVVEAVEGGRIYTRHFPALPLPPPSTSDFNIHPSGSRLAISWLVPSTSAVLQQTTDLATTNWTGVPTPPTLNLTNLHYEVPISPAANPRSFYRLKQQQ